MRILITSFGTTGEIYPFIALAQEFQRTGHRPLVALSPDCEGWCRGLGLDFVPIGPRADGIQNSLTLAVSKNPKLFSSFEEFTAVLRPLKASMHGAYEQLKRAAEGCECLVAGNLQPTARMVHEIIGVPYVSVCATVIAPNLKRKAYQEAGQWMVNPCRVALGLTPTSDPLGSDTLSDCLALYAISPSIMPKPSDWPAHAHFIGYFYLDEDWSTIDPALKAFLSLGPPPVAVSFGSMVFDDSKRVTDILVQAAELTNCRMVIQRGWGGLGVGVRSSSVYVADYVPHGWLFSRASCVIHHGGAGTSAAAFRAGTPVIVIPQILDQGLWAECAARLQVAAAVIPPSRLTAIGLSRAISDAVTNPKYRQAAVELANRIRMEEGVKSARIMIENVVNAGVR